MYGEHNAAISITISSPGSRPSGAQEWFDKALERHDADAALNAYEQAIRLLYNLGVLLDDMDRKVEAMQAYEAALAGDPSLADCHYNLALLCEKLEKPKEAIRHMAQYRALIGYRSK